MNVKSFTKIESTLVKLLILSHKIVREKLRSTHFNPYF